MCPHALKNAREALEEATQLAPEIAAGRPIGSLGHFWVRLNRARARTALQSLVEELRFAAQRATEAGEYHRFTGSASQITRALDTVDP